MEDPVEFLLTVLANKYVKVWSLFSFYFCNHPWLYQVLGQICCIFYLRTKEIWMTLPLVHVSLYSAFACLQGKWSAESLNTFSSCKLSMLISAWCCIVACLQFCTHFCTHICIYSCFSWGQRSKWLFCNLEKLEQRQCWSSIHCSMKKDCSNCCCYSMCQKRLNK